MEELELIEQATARVIASSRQYPFLFIGSGISRRYLGTPDWVGLLRNVCFDILGDDYAYASYAARARNILGISTLDEDSPVLLPEVASQMEPDIDRILLSEPRFAEFRSRHSDELRSGWASPMKVFISDMLARPRARDSQELDLLKRAGCGKVSGVITTNYDRLCEEIFPDFSVHVGERGMLFHEGSYPFDLYKIHGSIGEPGSLVLTTQDYKAFEHGKDYLAAKLLTIFLEYPVIFLGYSIQDENIKGMLASVARCVGKSRMGAVKDRLLFVQHSPDGIRAVGDVSFNFDGQTMVMTKVETDDFSPVYRAIAGARKEFSLRLMRELRGNVYRLATEVDPSSDVAVSGLDAVLSSPDASKKIVIGVARFTGEIGVPISEEDIFRDILLDDIRYDPRGIVTHYLNTFVRRRAKGVPVFKYASQLEWRDLGNEVEEVVHTRTSLESFRSKTLKDARGKIVRDPQRSEELSVAGMIEKHGRDKAYKKMGVLDEGEIDAEELHSYLVELLKNDVSQGLLKDSDFRKMVMVYDFVKYGCQGR